MNPVPIWFAKPYNEDSVMLSRAMVREPFIGRDQ
jgi:hypothetical protein